MLAGYRARRRRGRPAPRSRSPLTGHVAGERLAARPRRRPPRRTLRKPLGPQAARTGPKRAAERLSRGKAAAEGAEAEGADDDDGRAGHRRAVLVSSFFTPVDPDGGAWEATAACAGPWSEQMQHGGPPSALLVRQAEFQARATRDDLASYRVAVDFLGPVPVGPVEVRARVVRSGRSVVLVDSELAWPGGPACTRAPGWSAPRWPSPRPAVTGDDPPMPGPHETRPWATWDFPYAQHMEWRPVVGAAATRAGRSVGAAAHPAGPADVDNSPMTGLQRAVLLGDSGSGVSSELVWDEWAFLNIDLDLHLLRQPVSEWLHARCPDPARGRRHRPGHSTLRDEAGVVGTGNQTLVISPRS